MGISSELVSKELWTLSQLGSWRIVGETKLTIGWNFRLVQSSKGVQKIELFKTKSSELNYRIDSLAITGNSDEIVLLVLHGGHSCLSWRLDIL